MHRLVVVLLLLLVGITAILCDLTITVSSSNCGGNYSVADQSLFLNYYGEHLPTDCKFTISGVFTKDICSKPENFDVYNCQTTLEYYNYFYWSRTPDEIFGCDARQTDEYCTLTLTLIIVFKSSGGGSDNVQLKIYSENDGYRDRVINTVVTTVYVIIGVIVAVIVLVIVLIIVTIFCCCKSRTQAGTVYRQPVAAVPTTNTTGYPMNQTGIQPVQVGYQPPPQTGYQPQPGYQQPQPGFQQPQPGFQQPQPGFQQPPPQAGGFTNMPGYQQPAGGYPPAPQQSYTGADTQEPENASAPPPPYPGN